MSEKHILVTGGSGFIGSHIVGHHLQRGDQVWAVDNLQTGCLENIAPFSGHHSFQFDKADIRHWSKLQDAIAWADRIYHAAADVGQRFVIANPIDTLYNNTHSFERVLQLMCAVNSKARLLLTSTSELYSYSIENSDGTISEDALISLPSGKFVQQTYPASKLINEVTALAYTHEKGIFCTIVRIFNTIGLNQASAYGMVVPNLVEEALSNQPLTIFGDGTQSRSFGNVHDTVAALALLLENQDSKGEIVNVGCDRECSILDLALIIRKQAGSNSQIRYVPYKEAYGIDFIDVKRRRPDLKKLKKLTGFTPQWTLEQTIDEIIYSAKKRYASK